MKTCDSLLTLIRNLDDPSKYNIYMNKNTYDKCISYEAILYSKFYRLNFFTYDQLEDDIVLVVPKGTQDEIEYKIVEGGNE